LKTGRWVVLVFVMTAGVAAAGVGSSQVGPPPAWQRAAAKLKMPVFWPTETFGTKLKSVNAHRVPCGEPQPTEELEASYAIAPGSLGDGRTSWGIFEGRPSYCGNPGEASPIAHPLVHGIRGTLTCDWASRKPPHCSAKTKAYPNLYWVERGVSIAMFGLPRKQLLAAAESTQPIL
jgi:hypothetical protein